MAIADMGGAIAGKKIELLVADHQNKPDVAAAKAREWFDTQGVDMLDRRHQLRHRPGDGQGRAGEEEALHLGRRRDLGAHQRAVLALHRALRLRHDGARQGHRQRGRQGRRQDLVLPDRRLRLRHAAAERRDDGRQGRRRHGASASVRHPLVGERLLVVPAPGAAEQGADPRPGQRRRRHDQLDQGGQRVRHHQDDEARGPADVHQRRPLARPEGDAGHVPDRQLVLEPRRRVARLEPQVLRQVQAHAVVAAGGRLLGDAAVPDGRQGDRHATIPTRSWRR